MIAYDLQCENGHRFEGWFEDSESFDRQQEQGFIACPVCDCNIVSKIPSTFAIKGATTSPSVTNRNIDYYAAMGKRIVEYVEKNFDNVGADFAEEALKMHYGVSERRNIRGVSTPQEEETLRAEGINFYKFPVPPANSTDSDKGDTDKGDTDKG